MGSDLTPGAGPSALETFTEKLNLPHLVAGPAGKAISRLIAGVVEVPAAYLDSFAQGIKDKTAARTRVSNEVAEAAAKLASGDTDIVARAAHNLLAKEYRKQKNKEDISRRTVEILQDETKALPPPDMNSPTPEDVDPDWLNVFERFAEDASTDRMQEIWSRILAGEIRKPKTFSLATLRFISEVDERTATLFRKHAANVMAGHFIPYPENEGAVFSEMLDLQNAGLIVGVGGTLAKIFNFEPGPVVFPFKQGGVLVFFEKPADFRVGAILLTRVGQELYQITDCDSARARAELFSEKLPKGVISQVLYLSNNNKPELLWKREEPSEKSAPT